MDPVQPSAFESILAAAPVLITALSALLFAAFAFAKAIAALTSSKADDAALASVEEKVRPIVDGVQTIVNAIGERQRPTVVKSGLPGVPENSAELPK